MPQECYLCHSFSVRSFDPLGKPQSITTDGQFIPLPLLKAQCIDCGLVQTAQPFDGIFSYLSYQNNYAFYDRPNVRTFDTSRYRNYAQWVAGILPEQKKGYRVLEVGCGAAWVLENLRKAHPDIRVQGIEPSLSACQAANEAGISVVNAMADDPGLAAMHGRFDLVYSINVIEHTPDPTAFLRSMARFVRPEGTMCIMCPHGDVVDMELFFIDHLYTIRKPNLRHLFEVAGLEPVAWSRGPGVLNEFQQLTGRLSDQAIPTTSYACPATLLEKRDSYVRQWKELDNRLSERLEKHNEVLCFGAGETSDVLKALAPRAWEKIAGHVVDPVPRELRNASYRDKPLYYMDDRQLGRYDTALLGVRPHYQKMLRPRISEKFEHVICWDDIVESRVEVTCE